ncbi:hypothetical protein MSG37_17700 [Shewanella sp. 1CM18E]|uniref:hypothetical protein n=1 Tax=Shewanella sp. 1CM18E TaxID=2929169 RepID=UPI0020BDD1DB|nr:hypothetical protein [Shewanella sp. 1CM18E]MCK8046727.1 hypothetical protein [Shewanella sp. 1CM18E]
MAVLVIGAGFIFLGLILMDLPDLNRALKQHDIECWRTLTKQERFILSSERMNLFAWTLSRGFENAEHIDVQYAGLLAYRRATKVKYIILFGISLIIVGSVMAIVSQ